MPATPTTQHYLRAIAMLMGTIIGVGIFGVPFAIVRSGVAIGLLHVIILTGAILLVHLAFGEIVLRTRDRHRLVGYAERYLGSSGRRIATVSTVLGMYGALLAYIIVSGEFLHQLVGPIVGGSAWTWSIAFALLAIAAVAVGLRLIEELEFLLTGFLFVVMALIFIVGATRVNPAHWAGVNLTYAFLPYGVILFSLTGASAIAEIRDMLTGRERLLSRAIVWGTIVAAILTTLFALVVVGVSGAQTSPEAIVGLASILGRSIVILGALMGFLAIATSFLTLGVYLNEVFRLDFRFPRIPALLLSVGAPLAIFLIGNPDFTQVILITGAVFGGLDGLLVMLIAHRARRMGDRAPEYIVRVPAVVHWLVAAMFAIGIVATVWDLIR